LTVIEHLHSQRGVVDGNVFIAEQDKLLDALPMRLLFITEHDAVLSEVSDRPHRQPPNYMPHDVTFCRTICSLQAMRDGMKGSRRDTSFINIKLR
jgi:hypothetical protein